MEVLVLGGAGFIGGHIAKRHLERGDGSRGSSGTRFEFSGRLQSATFFGFPARTLASWQLYYYH